jgi:hypothetical protein
MKSKTKLKFGHGNVVIASSVSKNRITEKVVGGIIELTSSYTPTKIGEVLPLDSTNVNRDNIVELKFDNIKGLDVLLKSLKRVKKLMKKGGME